MLFHPGSYCLLNTNISAKDYWVLAAAAKSLQSCPTLWDPIDGSPPGSAIPGILQARSLESVAISFSNAWKWKVKKVSQSCPTLCSPMDCSLPGSSIHGIFQAKVLEWGAIAFSIYCVNPPELTSDLNLVLIIPSHFFKSKHIGLYW